MEVKGRKDFQLKHLNLPAKKGGPVREEYAWRRVVDSIDTSGFGITPTVVATATAAPAAVGAAPIKAVGATAAESAAPSLAATAATTATAGGGESQPATNSKQAVAFCISMKDGHKWERRRRPSSTVTAVTERSEYRMDTSPSQIRKPSSGSMAADNRSSSTNGRMQDSSPSTQSSQSSKSFMLLGSNQGSRTNLFAFNDPEPTTAGATAVAGRVRSSASPNSAERLGKLLGASSKEKLREQSMSLTPSSSSSSSSNGYIIDTRGIKGPIALPPALNLHQHLSLMPAPYSARRDGQPREIPLPPSASQSTSKRLSGTASNGVNTPKSNNNNNNNNNNKVFKDSRKILGKTLHAAGVALIMSTNSNSSDNIAGSMQDGGGESAAASSSPSLKHNHAMDGNLIGTISTSDGGDYSIAYEGPFRQKPLPFPMQQQSASHSIPSDGIVSSVETISAAFNSSSLVNIEDNIPHPVS